MYYKKKFVGGQCPLPPGSSSGTVDTIYIDFFFPVDGWMDYGLPVDPYGRNVHLSVIVCSTQIAHGSRRGTPKSSPVLYLARVSQRERALLWPSTGPLPLLSGVLAGNEGRWAGPLL
jgi:hypothetical protein